MLSFALKLAQSSPIIIIGLNLVIAVITKQNLPLIFSGLSIVFGFLLNVILKRMFMWINPHRDDWLRPNPPKDGCGIGILSQYDLNYGMPSGHAQFLTFTFAFWLLYLYRTKAKLRYLLTAIMIVLVYLVMYSRVYVGCHNWLQVMVGGLVGVISGSISFFAVEKLYLI